MRRVKTPTIIQMEEVECGSTALAIVLGYFGCYVPLAELRKRCGVTRDGSLALHIINAAKFYGLNGSGVEAEIEELKREPFPLIVFWEFNHFLVVEGITEKKVYINDPRSGPRTISYEEFDEKYTGIAIRFEKSETFQKAKGPKNLWDVFKEGFFDVKAPLFFLVLCGIGLLFPGLIMPGASQIFFDNIVAKGQSSWILSLFAIISLLSLFTFLFVYLQHTYLNRLNLTLSSRSSLAFLRHLLQLPLLFFSYRFNGEIASRLRLNETIAKSLTGNLVPILVNVALLVFYVVIMISYDLMIALLGIFAALLTLSLLLIINKSRTNSYARMQQAYGKSVGFSIGALQNIETIKACGNAHDFFSRWAGYSAKKLNAEREIYAKDVLLTSLTPFLQGMTITALLGIGSVRILSGDLTIGGLMALQALMTAFLLPLDGLIRLGSSVQTMKIDAMRLDDCMKNPIDKVYSKKMENLSQNEKLEGNLEFKNVTFGYSPLEPPLIENFSFSLKPGMRLAFVGESGSGKSTLTKLACGLYEPWSGEILYDGKPLLKIPRFSFTHSVGYVDQLFTMFSGTVKENLTFWNQSISDEALFLPLKDACIHEEIMLREGGYHAPVIENGANFSGGERQRLEIAKALMYAPTILILDEATSTLDSVTEEKILKNIKKRKCTCLMVAHRLSTIKECDEIIVLNKGKIVERGGHVELKALKGEYYDLVMKEQLS